MAPANFLDWRDRARSFTHVAAMDPWSFDLTGSGEPEVLYGSLVTEGFFPPKALGDPGHTSPVPFRRLSSARLFPCADCEDSTRRARYACLPLRSRFFPALRPPPAQAVTGAGAFPRTGGGVARLPSDAARSRSAAFATSCSRFALCSIFNQRALFLVAVWAA